MRPSRKEEAMQYVMLIYQGTTPLPGTEAWEALPQDEQKAVYADYQALNKTSGVRGAIATSTSCHA
jgi:hypothetical protein